MSDELIAEATGFAETDDQEILDARRRFAAAEEKYKAQIQPEADQVRAGPATILSNVAGDTVEAYGIEILKVVPGAENGRELVLYVTDPTLLAATGGIVQGMSGSPILQDGKFVGAVTHVLLSDPTKGYGIFLETMLDAAQ